MTDEKAVASHYIKRLKSLLDFADEDGLTLAADNDGEFYLKGPWDRELQRYNRYYLDD